MLVVRGDGAVGGEALDTPDSGAGGFTLTVARSGAGAGGVLALTCGGALAFSCTTALGRSPFGVALTRGRSSLGDALGRVRSPFWDALTRDGGAAAGVATADSERIVSVVWTGGRTALPVTAAGEFAGEAAAVLGATSGSRARSGSSTALPTPVVPASNGVDRGPM
jgi:hypothetical protein